MMTTPSRPPPSLIRRMSTTPMRDWIRGRLTGRLDRDRLLEDAALPGPLAELIRQVARRTRLWRTEKVEVTRELIAHFRDGLASGADPIALAADFGDPARAARLIRRAKRRGRPLPWRAMIYTRNGLAGILAAMVIIYIGLAARYFTGRPTISRDYLAELNHPSLSMSESDRAWPLYREGMFLLPPVPPGLDSIAGMLDALDPQDPRREPYIEYLRACGPALEKFAQAGERPGLGAILSTEDDAELSRHWERLQGGGPAAAPPPSAGEAPDLISVQIRYLGKFRSIARILAADAQLAALEQDKARVERDLQTMVALTDHTIDHPFLIGQLTGHALMAYSSEQILHHIDRYPDVLTEDQMRNLAHRLSSVSDGKLRVRLSGEIAFFDDLMQHLYTDDGHGDGRLAGGAVQLAQSLLSTLPFNHDRLTLDSAAGPLVMGVTAGRAEITRLYRSYVAEAQALGDQPMWDRGEPKVTASIEQLVADPFKKARYWPALLLIPAFDRLPASADATTQRRDAALTAIALELHRRRAGSYPESLAPLAPALLPELPPDQFDGRPIKYFIRDSRPVLYSIGPDRKDDRGRPPNAESPAAEGFYSPDQARRMLADPVQRARIDGDWILFPPAKPTVPPPEMPSPP
ncbi:MAG: hypothetical protein IT436_03845 [Phycisphaerales bacterium]|nr:hypothetical protein [Phycisphaerales bacterium]